MRETCELSTLAGEYANQANWSTGIRPVHSFPENQILTFLWRIGNQERARTAADYFASSVVSTGRHRVALVGAKFTTRGTKTEIIPGRNAKWNTKFPEFPNFQKKGQPREADQNFQNEFPKTFCSIRFWTGNSGNFGRMEFTLNLLFILVTEVAVGGNDNSLQIFLK